MKIAIQTFTFQTNYGCILQAYALQTVLERMGYEVEHLQEKDTNTPLHPIWKLPFVWCKRLLRKYLGGDKELPIFANPYKFVRRNTDAFITSYIHTRHLGVDEWSVKLAQDYDAIVFGSDQIWRPIYAEPLERYFGSFIETSPIKRIAYAASFGTDDNEYSPEQIQRCAALLRKFDAISVREYFAVSICKERFGVEASHLLDPTLLLDRNDYISFIQNAVIPPSKGTLGVYVLDENVQVQAFVEKISRQKGLKPFCMGSKVEDVYAPISDRIHPPVEQWIRAFYDAEFIVTDSYHGTVFSILFHKPFVCIGNLFRGMSRFHSLLNMFGLQERLVDISNLNQLDFSDIDWDVVDKVLFQKRKEAKTFLETSLN